MQTAIEANTATKKDSAKLLDALVKACESKIKEATGRGQFGVSLKCSEINQRHTRNALAEVLEKAGYDVVKMAVYKLINDELVEEVGELLVKWGGVAALVEQDPTLLTLAEGDLVSHCSKAEATQDSCSKKAAVNPVSRKATKTAKK